MRWHTMWHVTKGGHNHVAICEVRDYRGALRVGGDGMTLSDRYQDTAACAPQQHEGAEEEARLR